MRKPVVPALVLLSTAAALVACEVEVGTGHPARHPVATAPAATPVTPGAAPAPAPAPTPAPHPPTRLGRASRTAIPGSTPSTVPGATPGTPAAPSPTSPTPAGPADMQGTNVFGTGTPDPNGWHGVVFWVPAGTAKIPDLSTATPAGYLFASTLNVTNRPMTGGFPGIDSSRNENFAIRWEAALVVDNEADYTFHLSSDDGSILSIDGMKIVDDDGAHTLKDATGPVHLVRGTHAITVDYLQTTGNVALQLFCTRAGGSEQICPLRL